LKERVERARRLLACCRVCPRDCEVNRLEDETGICRTGRQAVVSSAFPHLGEEDCLRGRRGSGTIFFAHCNLQCVFCQNWDISYEGRGKALDAEEIASLMLELQAIGCHNINFVTPEHVVPQVVEAIAVAAERGLDLPIVYNTSAYDSLESLALLDGLIDVYMPDFKFWDPETAHRLAKARDYPEVARAAILEMHRQVGDLDFAPDGTARRGILLRHLVMPGQLDQSRSIFRWLVDEVSPDTFVNVMGQYRPEHLVGRPKADGTTRYAEIDRRTSAEDLRAAYEAARDAGLWRFDERL
jgi:putative pyruvate formate lyase activating enzyme